MQLEWKSHIDLSAMHAAWCCAHFPDRTATCSADHQKAAGDLAELAGMLGVPSERFWETLLTLSVDCQRNSDLAERMLVRLVPSALRSPSLTSTTAARIASVESAFRTDYSSYLAEIGPRTGPIKQLWEAHGPGLLGMIGRFTTPSLMVEQATVYLVQPIVGGAGYAHLQTNRVQFEAVLTNVDPALPETVRLAWLLSQLDFERPAYSERINAFALRRIAGLSMIPPALLAASELELCNFTVADHQRNVELIHRAIKLWHADATEANSQAVAEVLMTWWETYQAGRPDWSIALTGLDRML